LRLPPPSAARAHLPSVSPCSLPLRRPPPPTLFPYTTLFRSRRGTLRRLPLLQGALGGVARLALLGALRGRHAALALLAAAGQARSEEHTSELQSRENLVCRLLLEKKNARKQEHTMVRSRGKS